MNRLSKIIGTAIYVMNSKSTLIKVSHNQPSLMTFILEHWKMMVQDFNHTRSYEHLVYIIDLNQLDEFKRELQILDVNPNNGLNLYISSSKCMCKLVSHEQHAKYIRGNGYHVIDLTKDEHNVNKLTGVHSFH